MWGGLPANFDPFADVGGEPLHSTFADVNLPIF